MASKTNGSLMKAICEILFKRATKEGYGNWYSPNFISKVACLQADNNLLNRTWEKNAQLMPYSFSKVWVRTTAHERWISTRENGSLEFMNNKGRPVFAF